METGGLGEIQCWGKGTVTVFSPDNQWFGDMLSLGPCKISRRRIENVVPELRTEEKVGAKSGFQLEALEWIHQPGMAYRVS